MRVKSVHLESFGSYKTLDLTFGKGLTLIQGPNGAGKSTVFDAVPWILFGRTAKNGKADEVKSWFGGTTHGTANIESSPGITVYRSRGPNDLVIDEAGRGKDILDTQRRIDERLGVTWDIYQRGAYYHEFSDTAQFFTATAKSRRDLCESIANLSLALKIQDKATDRAKDILSSLQDTESAIFSEGQKITVFLKLTETESKKVTEWRRSHEIDVRRAEESAAGFERNRRKTISNQCRACGTALKAPIEVFDDSPNPYESRLQDLRAAVCPYDGTVRSYNSEINTAKRNITGFKRRLGELNQDRIDLEVLQGAIKDFRSLIIKNTIDYVTAKTNTLIQDYFDGELSMALEVQGSDKLDVTIQKDGNIAAFTQLSKGQRQILKLCFSVAVMEAVSNHSGVKFEQIMLDESLDGLSDTMKVKAFRLFEYLSLSHEDVWVIDHSEALKAMFPNIITVTNEDGNSTINAST